MKRYVTICVLSTESPTLVLVESLHLKRIRHSDSEPDIQRSDQLTNPQRPSLRVNMLTSLIHIFGADRRIGVLGAEGLMAVVGAPIGMFCILWLGSPARRLAA
jgi:hypothetical protein